MIRIYTDGACSGNPGEGGWSNVICLSESVEKAYGYDAYTTNNRMELTAVVNAVFFAVDYYYYNGEEKLDVEILSDSSYVINALNDGWLEKWKSNGYVNARGEEVKNTDLWTSLDEVLNVIKEKKLNITFTKVKGHAGNSMNELADHLAVNATKIKKAYRSI